MSSVFVRAGMKELLMAAGGAAFPDKTGFDATPPTIYGLGYRDAGTLEISHINQDVDKDDREFPNMINVKAEYPSKQMDMQSMKFFISCALNSSISAKMITGKPTINADTIVSADGGIFSFDGQNSLGYKFELEVTPKTRYMKHILERAYKYSNPLPGFLADASTATAPYKTNTLPMFKKSAVPVGFINPSYVTVADEVLADFKISIKVDATKNLFNKDLNNAFDVELTAARSNPTVSEILDWLTHSFKGAVTLRVPLGTSAPEDDLLINFAVDGLTQRGGFKLEEKKREGSVILKGKYDMDYATVDSSGINFNTFM